MGCIPSKHAVLEMEGVHSTGCAAWKSRRAQRKERSRAKKARELESPVTSEGAPPWVGGHALFTEKNGQYMVVEHKG